MKKEILTLCALLPISLSACASHSDSIQANYVSPLQYQDYSCHQIRAEIMRMSQKVNQMSGAQDKEASGDTVATTVGLVLFWPALFFIGGNDHRVELAQMKGEYEALQEEAVQKNCDVAKEMKAAEKSAEKQKQQQEIKHQSQPND